jgi:predicted xylan-binding protein with Ca-dependent carbohydrate-binding module/cellulase (glycosyl hydrolase family 5)
MKNTLSRLHRIPAPVTRGGIAFLVALGLVFSISTFAADNQTVVAKIEAEMMRWTDDGSAPALMFGSDLSGGKAANMWWNGTIASQYGGGVVNNVTVRAKGSYCSGNAKLALEIDQQSVGQWTVNTSWNDYSASVQIPAGIHTVGVTFLNDKKTRSCDRNLKVDYVTLYGPTNTPSPSPKPSLKPTATPVATPTPAPKPTPVPPTSAARKIFGVNNSVGWGGIADARSKLGVNGDRVCHDETNMDTTLPKLAAQGMYFSVCVNSDEGMTSLDSHRQDYANTVASVAKKYGPGGTYWATQPQYAQYGVETIELMNEPYGWWYRGGDNDPAAFARIAASAIKAGKAANPKAKFYLPLSATDVKLKNGTWVKWNQEMLKAQPDLFQLADGFSIHLYYTPSQFASLLDQTKTWTWSQAGGNGKPFIITEANLTDQQASPETEYVKAIPQFVQIADSRSWVNEIFIFSWHGFSGRDYLGFLDSAGNPRQGRIDAYHGAIQQALNN